jgi:hypothetical protein
VPARAGCFWFAAFSLQIKKIRIFLSELCVLKRSLPDEDKRVVRKITISTTLSIGFEL